MSYEVRGTWISLKAAASMVGKKFYAVSLSAADTCALAGATDIVLGIVQKEAIAGEATPIAVDGITFAVAGGIISAGDRVRADADGKLIKVAATGPSIGIALDAAGAEDDLFSLLIQPLHVVVGA